MTDSVLYDSTRVGYYASSGTPPDSILCAVVCVGILRWRVHCARQYVMYNIILYYANTYNCCRY